MSNKERIMDSVAETGHIDRVIKNNVKFIITISLILFSFTLV